MTLHSETNRIETTRFGALELPEDAIIRFPCGLYGLEGPRAYCLLNHDEWGRFQWLQAADAPAIAMIVTDPFQFFPEYEVEISDPAAALLAAGTAADVSIYTPITIDADRREIYANLLGPIAINPTARLGVQLIQDAGRYSTRHRIDSGIQAGYPLGERPGRTHWDRVPAQRVMDKQDGEGLNINGHPDIKVNREHQPKS